MHKQCLDCPKVPECMAAERLRMQTEFAVFFKLINEGVLKVPEPYKFFDVVGIALAPKKEVCSLNFMRNEAFLERWR